MSTTLDPDNKHSAVYIAARREWNERYGDYIAQARNWRFVAFGSVFTAILATGGMVWQAKQSHIVPYVVAVDKLGDQLAISRADVSPPGDIKVIRASLARWIADVRSVYADQAAERRVIAEAFAMVDGSSAGAATLNDWFSANSPFDRAATETVSVEVHSVLPLSGNTWRVEWQENRYSQQGGLDAIANWQGTITINIKPPTDDATILANPGGLYIASFNWSQRPTS